MAGFRVVIVGENTQWRESLTMAFRAGSTGEVIAAQSSDEFFNGPRLYPDVVVWKMEDNCPDDLALSLPSFCPLPIVIVDNPNHCNISYLLRAGIKGCLPSRLLPIQIVHTIELTVHAGLLCLPRMSPEAFQDENSPTADYLKQLTPREIQILRLLGKQASNQEIADTLYISLSTTKSHLRSIYRKLGIHGRSEAISFVINSGLVDKVQGFIGPNQKITFP
jgi:DNA-binding NarL/FixJ family response regulator